MRKQRFFSLLITVISIILISPLVLHAEITLPKILGSNMVLQRNAELKIWGWADKGERVTVEFNGQVVKTRTGKSGKWLVTLEPMKVGGPFTMTISGENTIVLDNILLGDVWICSGQSNMEWSMTNVNNAEEEIISANYPDIRLFDVPHNVQLVPVEDIPSGEWNACSPATVPNFSAVAYFFGRHIHREEGVPIGLISTNWGGTNVETWTSTEMALTDPEMAEAIRGLEGMTMETFSEQQKKEKEMILASLGELSSGMVDGKPVWADPELDLSDWEMMDVPGLWEDQGLRGVDGVVWFRTTFTLSATQAENPLVLMLGPIDDSDITWVNGSKVGETMDRYSAKREYTVDAGILVAGENSLVIRVEDYRGGGGLYGNPAKLKAVTSEGDVPLAGKWKYRVSSESLEVNINVSLSPNSKPTLLFNGMIHPLLNYAALGAIWYQGESNAGNAYRYRTRFPNMIRDWRNHWNNPDMGFYFVQLANFKEAVDQPDESDWAELREAQTMALSVPKTGMAVIIDIGEADDIHPRNKQDVGYRLALAALHDTYGRDLVYSGPVFRSMEITEGKVMLEFDPMGSELVVKDKYGYVKGFALAGEDQEFHWARGIMKDGKIWLWSDQVKEPVAVRYAWADNPDDANIYNADGLPAGPFRTDDWPGITYRK